MQFLVAHQSFSSLPTISQWAKNLRFNGIKIPTWATDYFDLQKTTESKTYADEIKGMVNEMGLKSLNYLRTYKANFLSYTRLTTNNLMVCFVSAESTIVQRQVR